MEQASTLVCNVLGRLLEAVTRESFPPWVCHPGYLRVPILLVELPASCMNQWKLGLGFNPSNTVSLFSPAVVHFQFWHDVRSVPILHSYTWKVNDQQGNLQLPLAKRLDFRQQAKRGREGRVEGEGGGGQWKINLNDSFTLVFDLGNQCLIKLG